MKQILKLLSIVLLVATVLAACSGPPTGGGTPEVTINNPARDPDTNELVVSGTVTSDVTINSINYVLTRTSDDSEVANGSITLGDGGAFEVRLAENALTDGEEYELTVTVDYEGADQPVTESVTFTYEAPAPEELELTVDAPQDGSEVFTDTVTVSGSVANAVGDVTLSYNLNGGGEQDVTASLTDGSFSFEVSGLTEGANTLVVSASDGTNNDEVTLNLTYSVLPTTEFSARVAARTDDALEFADSVNASYPAGATWTENTTMSFMYQDFGADEYGPISAAGMRFVNVTIPQGATIVSARIEFTALATRPDAITLNVAGEASDNAATFVDKEVNNITGRTTTTSEVSWETSDWTTGTVYSTNDISDIVQEIVDRGGWTEGNAMAFIITGTPDSSAFQTAESHRSDATAAPRLVIEYETP